MYLLGETEIFPLENQSKQKDSKNITTTWLGINNNNNNNQKEFNVKPKEGKSRMITPKKKTKI